MIVPTDTKWNAAYINCATDYSKTSQEGMSGKLENGDTLLISKTFSILCSFDIREQ